MERNIFSPPIDLTEVMIIFLPRKENEALKVGGVDYGTDNVSTI